MLQFVQKLRHGRAHLADVRLFLNLGFHFNERFAVVLQRGRESGRRSVKTGRDEVSWANVAPLAGTLTSTVPFLEHLEPRLAARWV